MNKNSYPDIYFGLKGGFNNFGIVTNFNVRVVPQTHVYAGIIFYVLPQFRAVFQAMANFQAMNKDPKAAISGFLTFAGGQLLLLLYCIYDASVAPTGTFDGFLAIPHTFTTLQSQSFFSFIQSTANPALPR